jgi:hypothetical protein
MTKILLSKRRIGCSIGDWAVAVRRGRWKRMFGRGHRVPAEGRAGCRLHHSHWCGSWSDFEIPISRLVFLVDSTSEAMRERGPIGWD